MQQAAGNAAKTAGNAAMQAGDAAMQAGTAAGQAGLAAGHAAGHAASHVVRMRRPESPSSGDTSLPWVMARAACGFGQWWREGVQKLVSRSLDLFCCHRLRS